ARGWEPREKSADGSAVGDPRRPPGHPAPSRRGPLDGGHACAVPVADDPPRGGRLPRPLGRCLAARRIGAGLEARALEKGPADERLIGLMKVEIPPVQSWCR